MTKLGVFPMQSYSFRYHLARMEHAHWLKTDISNTPKRRQEDPDTEKDKKAETAKRTLCVGFKHSAAICHASEQKPFFGRLRYSTVYHTSLTGKENRKLCRTPAQTALLDNRSKTSSQERPKSIIQSGHLKCKTQRATFPWILASRNPHSLSAPNSRVSIHQIHQIHPSITHFLPSVSPQRTETNTILEVFFLENHSKKSRLSEIP